MILFTRSFLVWRTRSEALASEHVRWSSKLVRVQIVPNVNCCSTEACARDLIQSAFTCWQRIVTPPLGTYLFEDSEEEDDVLHDLGIYQNAEGVGPMVVRSLANMRWSVFFCTLYACMFQI